MLSCTLGLPQLQPRAARNICLPLPQEALAEPRAPLSLACPCALWFTICRPIIALLFICARLLAVFVGGPLPSASLSVQWFQIAGLVSIFMISVVTFTFLSIFMISLDGVRVE